MWISKNRYEARIKAAMITGEHRIAVREESHKQHAQQMIRGVEVERDKWEEEAKRYAQNSDDWQAKYEAITIEMENNND